MLPLTNGLLHASREIQQHSEDHQGKEGMPSHHIATHVKKCEAAGRRLAYGLVLVVGNPFNIHESDQFPYQAEDDISGRFSLDRIKYRRHAHVQTKAFGIWGSGST